MSLKTRVTRLEAAAPNALLEQLRSLSLEELVRELAILAADTSDEKFTALLDEIREGRGAFGLRPNERLIEECLRRRGQR